MFISQQTASIPQNKRLHLSLKTVRQHQRKTVNATHRLKTDAKATPCDLPNISLY